ncbi:MAG: PEGA domain-containing protein, partial [Acidobacteriota bacterium]
VEKIGKYRILEKIGKGGMGVVYKAMDPRIGRIVAVKTLFAHRGDDAELRHRFLQEARSAGALSHKNIITIYEMDEDEGQAFIAMEYLEGEDMKSLIARRATLPFEHKLQILLEVCEGLAHAHSMGVIHRDIKPGNIFLTKTGQIKLLDFGLARITTSDATLTGMPMGTPSYMSPEQIRGEKQDHRSDIFSFGVVAYELLAYSKPFQAESEYAIAFKITKDEPTAIETFFPTIPIELSSVIGCSLEKDPSRRYQHAEDLLRELEAVRGLLEERKRALRSDAREAIGQLERLVGKNRDLLDDVAEKLEAMKQDAPDFFESSITASASDLTPRKRKLQLDYLALLELSERARREFEKVETLLKKREKKTYLLREAEDLEKGGQWESALKILDFLLQEDPGYAAPVKLREKILNRQTTLDEEARLASRAAELLAEAEEVLRAGNVPRCLELIANLDQLQPQNPAVQALREQALAKQRELAALEEQRRFAEQALAAARNLAAEGSFASARAEIAKAETAFPRMQEITGLREQIEQAELEAREKAARREQVRALLAEAAELEKAGQEENALHRLHGLLELEPDHIGALRLRSSIEERRERRRLAEELFRQAADKLAAEELEAAETLAEQAIESDPAHARARTILQQVRSRLEKRALVLRKREQAEKALEQARSLLAARDFSRAGSLLKDATGLDPELPGLKELEEELRRAEEQNRLETERQRQVHGLLAEAVAALDRQDHGHALALLADLLRLDPDHRRGSELKKEAESRQRAAELAEQRKRERVAQTLQRAHDAAQRGELEVAIESARAVEPDCDSPDEVRGLIQGWAEDIRRRREAEERRRKNIAKKLDSGRRLIAARRFSDALTPVQEALRLQADHPEALDLLKQAEEAIEHERRREAREQEGQHQRREGLRLLADKKHRDSLIALRRAAELLGADSAVELAIREAESELQAEEMRAQIQSGIVEARRFIGAAAHAKAHESLLRVLKLDPEQAEARKLLEKAEASLRWDRTRARIAALLTESRDAMARGDFPAATRLASEILVIDSENSEARELLQRIDATQQEKSRRMETADLLARSSNALAAGEFQQAAAHARAVLLMSENNAEARLLLRRIDAAQAEKHKLDRIATLIGQARRAKTGADLDGALAHLREVLSLEPGQKEARALLKQVEKAIRQRDKRLEGERKRQAAAGSRAGDDTLVLPSRKVAALPAILRSPWLLAPAAVALVVTAVVLYRGFGGAAMLSISSEPDAVSIRVNNREVGVTSGGRLELTELAPGTVILEGRKEGYAPFVQQLTLSRGDNPPLGIRLAPVGAELRIRTDQAAVSVQVDGQEVGKTSVGETTASFRVPEGAHTVALIKEGYLEVKRDVRLASGETLVIDEKLESLAVKVDAAVLRILSNPPEAAVFLDGRRVGSTAGGSLMLQGLKPGPVRLAIRKEGYQDWEASLQLEAGRAIDRLVTLAARPAVLLLSTNVPGAQVFIDSVPKGQTDARGAATLEGIPPDSRTVKVTRDGYQERLERLDLQPGASVRMQMNLSALVASPALLSVSSEPPEAAVYVDDQYRGSTPLNNLQIEPGARRIRLRRDGYRETERSLSLRAGEPRAEAFILEKMMGFLVMSVQPEGATARIGNRTIDTTRQPKVELEPGTYTAELNLKGYKPVQRTITILDRQTVNLQAVLEAATIALAGAYTDAFLTLDGWDHPSGWQADSLLRATAPGFGILKDRLYANFRESFQIRLNQGVQASWVVRWQDERNYCLIQIYSDRHSDRSRKNTIYFSTYRDGRPTAIHAVPLPFQFGKGKPEWIDIRIEVSGNRVVARGSVVAGTTTTGGEMGRYTLPDGIGAAGKIGFLVLDDEQFEVSGLVIEPAG